jgi:hypothetical protein
MLSRRPVQSTPDRGVDGDGAVRPREDIAAMSTAVRRADLTAVHWRYRRWGIPGVCYYCGCLGDSYDHVPPVSLAPIEHEHCQDMPFWLIPSCRECNVHLGNLPVLLIGARKAHLLRKYRVKYRKALSTPPWTEAELKRVRYNLRAKIEAAVRVREAAEARLGVLTRECIEPTLEDYLERLRHEAA